MDMGDNVIIINADKVVITANKATQNFRYRHSGYPGGIRSTSWGTLLADDPEKLVYEAVKGMIPKNRLGRQVMAKLHVYKGAEHPHIAQAPKMYDTSAIRRG
jgi:large subunit ribosomal protein L13